MGFLDIPFPLFFSFDRVLREVVPPLGALILWGVIAAILTMLLYRMVSSQRAISEVGADAARARRVLLSFDGEIADMRPVAVAALGRSAKQMQLTLVPAIIASLPLLSLLAWLNLEYGHRYPGAGSMVEVETLPTAADVTWEPAAEPGARPGLWRIRWPADGEAVVLLDAQRRAVLSLPPSAPVTILHKRQWWNTILENPIGYIPRDAALDRVELALPTRNYLEAGPGWLRGWEATFFAVLVLCSLAIKIAFRIK